MMALVASRSSFSSRLGGSAMMNYSDDGGAAYALFGKVILLWGHVETALISILLRVTHPLFGLPGHEGVPMAFSRKIKLAKRGYSEIPEMSSLRPEAESAFSALWPLSEQRDIIVHGYYQGFTGSSRYMFGRYELRQKRTRGFRFHYFTDAEIAELVRGIEKSWQRLDDLSARTFQVPFPK